MVPGRSSAVPSPGAARPWRHGAVRRRFDRIRALAADIPPLWNAVGTPRLQPIVHVLVEPVTMTILGYAEEGKSGVLDVGPGRATRRGFDPGATEVEARYLGRGD